MSFRSRQFKALEEIWYGKLKEDGFEDIEDHTKRERPLCSWHSFKFPALNAEQREARIVYFEAAKMLLLTHTFEKPIERFIWSLHCEGLSKREIETAVAESNFEKKYKRETILNIITRIAAHITYDG